MEDKDCKQLITDLSEYVKTLLQDKIKMIDEIENLKTRITELEYKIDNATAYASMHIPLR